MGSAGSTSRQGSSSQIRAQPFYQQQVVSTGELHTHQSNGNRGLPQVLLPRSNTSPLQQHRNLAPRLDIQQTCVVKNPVNLKKKTLVIEKDAVESHIYYLDFSFDSATEAEISIYFECKEVIHPETGIPQFETSSEKPPVVRTYPEGMNQHYRSTKEEALNLLDHQLQDMQYTEDSTVFPVVIQLRSLGDSSLVQSQCTYGTLTQRTKGNQNVWAIQTLKQKIQYGQKCFEVQEIFGIERGGSGGINSADEFLSGRECVICLAEDRNTAVLPCRHMCLCSGCANVMRLQSNKCPICRQSVNSLLQISVNQKSKSTENILNENRK